MKVEHNVDVTVVEHVALAGVNKRLPTALLSVKAEPQHSSSHTLARLGCRSFNDDAVVVCHAKHDVVDSRKIYSHVFLNTDMTKV